MAALLVALAVMSIMLSVAMPVWKQMAQREKEEELVFRGQQYARAIGLFQRRAGPGVLPPNFDVLVQQRFLRKKYKDPITGEDFLPLLAGQPAPGAPAGAGGPPGPTGPGRGTTPAGRGSALTQPGQVPGGVGAVAGAVGGIQGVVSKSKAKSIRIFNGRNVYNEWAFVYVRRSRRQARARPERQADEANRQAHLAGREASAVPVAAAAVAPASLLPVPVVLAVEGFRGRPDRRRFLLRAAARSHPAIRCSRPRWTSGPAIRPVTGRRARRGMHGARSACPAACPRHRRGW